MIIGIVGSEAAKFTEKTETEARRIIIELLHTKENPVTKVVSGGCHLGGIDQWAIEAAEAFDVDYTIYPPSVHRWSDGYKPRNQKIAEASDKVVCITIREFPPDYKGLRFPYCYHCKTSDHIKSGGCWTVKYAKSLGKLTEVIVV
jgi:hypothetical protein